MNRKWYEDAVIYHMYSLSLSKAPFLNDYTTQGRGLTEIAKWIPHIKGMGFNTVLFSPVFKSRTHGYDVTDYKKIDNRLGTNEEFRALVKQFHENGIRVILDCVFNHCGRDFFAFKELLQGDKEYADWFSGVDFNRQSPHGDPFDYKTWNGYYELPKFNLHNPNVKKYLLDAAKYWIETFDIDGMRLDTADVLDAGFMTELRHLTKTIKSNFWLVGEVVHGDYRKWVNDWTLHSVTNYILYKSLYSSHNDNNLFELAYAVSNAVPNKGIPLYTFLDNHDQSRIASNTSHHHLNTLYTLLFTLPGIPSVYYGSEWGIRGVKEDGSDHPLRPYIDIDKCSDYNIHLTGYINKLISIRQSEKTLRYGSYEQVYLDYMRPFAFSRSYENEKIFIAVSIFDYDEVVDLSAYSEKGFKDLLTGEQLNDTRQIWLKPHSARLLK